MPHNSHGQSFLSTFSVPVEGSHKEYQSPWHLCLRRIVIVRHEIILQIESLPSSLKALPLASGMGRGGEAPDAERGDVSCRLSTCDAAASSAATSG